MISTRPFENEWVLVGIMLLLKEQYFTFYLPAFVFVIVNELRYHLPPVFLCLLYCELFEEETQAIDPASLAQRLGLILHSENVGHMKADSSFNTESRKQVSPGA